MAEKGLSGSRSTSSLSLTHARRGTVEVRVNLDSVGDEDIQKAHVKPAYGYVQPLSKVFRWPNGKPIPNKPAWSQIVSLLPLAYRFWRYSSAVKAAGRIPFMDVLNPLELDPYKGVPIGGIGAGTICRSIKGQFDRWNLKAGIYEYHTVWQNQFIVRIERPGKPVFQRVLCATAPPAAMLPSWDWSYNGENAEYHGLYPRAWITYDFPDLKVRLVCRQTSPVIPHNYVDTSLPVGVFDWTVENYGDDDVTVTIAFAWRNGYGKADDFNGGHSNYVFKSSTDSGVIRGVELSHRGLGQPYSFSIAVLTPPEDQEDTTCSYDARWVCSGNGSDLWQPLLSTGDLRDNDDMQESAQGEIIGAAVASRFKVKPKQTRAPAKFGLSWDFPLADFDQTKKLRYKRYTRFFDKRGDSSLPICVTALYHSRDWDWQIYQWQSEVLLDIELPPWYKSALFNETYYMSDGGTVWLDNEGHDSCGRFGYLEGHEYRMYTTYDVHFYASWAITMLWPRLAANVTRDFGEDPFEMLNAYNIHDTAEWKDLNPKFVLQVYRDYKLMGDKVDLLEYCWKAMSGAMQYMLRYDKDGDGMIENEGFPDQTYDIWTVTGVSAYCGGQLLEDKDVVAKDNYQFWQSMYDKAVKVYHDRLWKDGYYHYDGSSSSYSNSIQADQLAGHFYLVACGLPSYVPEGNALSALSIIHDNERGAINGARPDGTPDTTCMQSMEVWTGTSYQLAATMIAEGLVEEGFETARGVYMFVWEVEGMAYQTPEGYYPEGNYRSLAYMRPLSIWAIQYAWCQAKGRKAPPPPTAKSDDSLQSLSAKPILNVESVENSEDGMDVFGQRERK